MQTPLTNQLAAQISDYIRAERAPKGARLVERALADRLMVSRSPIRSALRLLAAEGIVGNADRGGYVVLEPNRSFPRASLAAAGDEEAYYRVAEDRLKGTLPERISERALEREYGLTRVDLAKVLRRIANEGWIERLPGHGWRFLPMLTSLQSYEDSYRFRLTIEPAAILEPRFVLNIDALQKCRAQQERLVDGEIWRISKGDLFDINSHLHEAVISCSQNTFFVDSLKRLNKLRRLIEYKQALHRKEAIVRCQEHVQLVDLLLAGKRKKASEFMRGHLSSLSVQKTLSANATFD